MQYILLRIALAIGISIAALLISTVLDALLAPLPLPLQFMAQIPSLVIIMEEIRLWLIRRLPTLDESAVNSTFFLAAPIAALGARDLFDGLGSLMRV
jgi:hypothetical protein